MAVTAAELQVKVSTVGAQQASSELRDFGAQIDSAGAKASKASGQLRDAQGRFVAVGGAADGAGKRMAGAGKGAGLLDKALGGVNAKSLVAGAGIASAGVIVSDLGKKAINAAIDFETAFAGVAKTVDATDAELDVLERGIRDMATTLPMAATELASIAEQAGALGIATGDILQFTETVALIGTTTDVSSDQAATALGQLSNVLGLTADDYERFGSTLVDLGNKGASTESAILGVTNRAGAAAELIGFATEETLGWSAALANTGMEVEAAGSSLQRFFVDSQKHVAAAGEELKIMAETAGMTGEAFAQAFSQDSSAALQSFIVGLGDLAQAEQLAVLEALGFNDIRITRALLGLASNTDNLTDSLNTSEQAWRANNAMQVEADKRFATTASQIQLFKNNLNELNLALAEGYLPPLRVSLEFMNLWAQGVHDITDELRVFRDGIVIVGGAMLDYIPAVEVGEDRTSKFGFALLEAAKRAFPAYSVLNTGTSTFRALGVVADENTESLEANADAVEEWARRIALAIPGAGHAAQEQKELTQEQHRGVQAAAEYGVEINNLDSAHRAYVSSSQMVADATRRQNMEFDASVAAMDATTAGYDRAIAAMIDIFHNAPEAADQVVDDLVMAFQNGRLDLDSIMRIFGQIPEDAIYEHFLPAFKDLRTDWQVTIAELGDSPEAEAGLRALDEIMQALGLTFDTTAQKALNFGDIQDVFQLNIDNAAAGVSEWEDNLSGAEKALGFLQEKIDAGIPLTDEQQKQYEDLTWATERYAGGVEDEAEALIDAEVAKANFVKIQDELNAALESGEITQAEYNEAIGAAAAEMDPATAASMGLVDAQGALQETIDGTVEKLVKLMVELGILDETEAEAILGVDITEAEAKTDHMEGRLQTYEETDHITTADVDDSGAVARIDGIEGELTAYAGATWTTTVTADVSAAEAEIARIKSIISSGAMLPVAISASENLSGYAKGTPPGGTTKDQIAWVGEEGPELVFLPQGAHVLPNDESKKFAALMGEIPGFQDGTGSGMAAGSMSISGFGPAGEQAGADFGTGFSAGAIREIRENPVDWSFLFEDLPEDAQEAFEQVGENFGRWLPSLEDIVSGEAGDRLQDSLAEMMNWLEIADELNLAPEIVAWLEAEIARIEAELVRIGEIAGSDVAQGIADAIAEAEMPIPGSAPGLEARAAAEAEEWAETVGDAVNAAFEDNPIRFGMSLEESIAELETKLDAAAQGLIDVPADIVAGWEQELAGLEGQSDAFWATFAEGIAAGLIDPSVLEELDAAGRAQVAAFLEPIIGEEGVDRILDGFDEVSTVTADGLAELESLFEENGELAAGHIDDLVQAAIDGSITWADALGLMSEVPRDELLPVLEDLERKFEDDLVQAILATDEAAQAVAEEGLAKVRAAIADVNSELGDLMGFSEDFAKLGSGGVGVITSTGGFDDQPSGSGGGSSSGGGRGSSTSGNTTDPNALRQNPPDGALNYFYDRRQWQHMLGQAGAENYLATADARGVSTFRYNPPGGGDDTSIISFDAAADVLLGTGRLRQYAAFARGGVTSGPQFALLGDNPSGTEAVIPLERAGEFASLMVQELLGQMGGRAGGGDLVLQVDGKELGRITSGHVYNQARGRGGISGIPVGARRG